MTVALYSNYKLVVKVEKPGFAEETRFLAIFEVINYEYNMLLVGLNSDLHQLQLEAPPRAARSLAEPGNEGKTLI